jgi:predicted DNA-binding protein
MRRTQVQLTEQQNQRLRRISQERNVSIAELVREAIDAHFANGDPLVLRARAIASIGGGHSGLHNISERHDDYLAEDFAK